MMRSSKAQTTPYILTWIVFTALMLVIIFGSMLFWLDGKINVQRDTFNADAGILAQRLLFSPNALGATDSLTGRPLPGIIDGAKLIDKDINKALLDAVYYGEPNNVIAAKITIGSQVVHYNEQLYRRLLPQLGASGPGATRGITITATVLVREENRDEPALATVEVLRVNEI
ncbi:hypothetical protein HY493_02180 [Candidatus Woesearchaeota archaeon]|nr:hypothetical protein [Candidatus Woesearchaeota archaeon]